MLGLSGIHVPLEVRYIPSWLPGGTWKKKATEWRKYGVEFPNLPFDATKAAWASPSNLHDSSEF
jgi:hypothetical protein